MENNTYSNIEKITDEAPRNAEHKELETVTIASIETLKRQKMKCNIDEVCKLVQDSLEENISLESLEKTLQHLIDNDSVKFTFMAFLNLIGLIEIVAVVEYFCIFLRIYLQS